MSGACGRVEEPSPEAEHVPVLGHGSRMFFGRKSLEVRDWRHTCAQPIALHRRGRFASAATLQVATGYTIGASTRPLAEVVRMLDERSRGVVEPIEFKRWRRAGFRLC
jgi:hypothetical protein